jgi:hypothetical protein
MKVRQISFCESELEPFGNLLSRTPISTRAGDEWITQSASESAIDYDVCVMRAWAIVMESKKSKRLAAQAGEI